MLVGFNNGRICRAHSRLPDFYVLCSEISDNFAKCFVAAFYCLRDNYSSSDARRADKSHVVIGIIFVMAPSNITCLNWQVRARGRDGEPTKV